MTIHVVGNVCLDTSFHLPRLPRPGETLNATVAGDGLGGKGANQAVAAARTGAAVRLWAALGRDADSARMESLLAAEIADTRLSRLDLPGDRSTILIDRAGENIVVTAAACAEAFDPLASSALLQSWRSGDMLLMQGNLRPAVTAACLAAAHADGLYTVFNPSPLPDEPPDLTTVNLLVVNRPEAEGLTGEGDPARAAGHLRAMGAHCVVVTLGADGALVADAAGALHVPALSAPAVDTSGAGDCFAGTLAGLLSRGMTLTDAARLATRAAGMAVGRFGTLASFPNRQELHALIETLKTETV